MTDNGGGTPGNRASDADGDSWFKPSENRYRTQSEYQDPLEEDAASNPGEDGAVFPDSGGYAGLSASRPAMVEPYPDALGGPPSAPGISYPGAGTSAYEPVTRFPGEDPLAAREPEAPAVGGYPGIAASAEVPLPPEEPVHGSGQPTAQGPFRDSWAARSDAGSDRDPLRPQASSSGAWDSEGPSDPAPWSPQSASEPDPSFRPGQEPWAPEGTDERSPLASASGDSWASEGSSDSGREPWDPAASGDARPSGGTGDLWSPDDTPAFSPDAHGARDAFSGSGQEPWDPEAGAPDSRTPYTSASGPDPFPASGREPWEPEGSALGGPDSRSPRPSASGDAWGSGGSAEAAPWSPQGDDSSASAASGLDPLVDSGGQPWDPAASGESRLPGGAGSLWSSDDPAPFASDARGSQEFSGSGQEPWNSGYPASEDSQVPGTTPDPWSSDDSALTSDPLRSQEYSAPGHQPWEPDAALGGAPDSRMPYASASGPDSFPDPGRQPWDPEAPGGPDSGLGRDPLTPQASASANDDPWSSGYSDDSAPASDQRGSDLGGEPWDPEGSRSAGSPGNPDSWGSRDSGSSDDPGFTADARDPLDPDTPWSASGPGEELWKSGSGREQPGEWRGTGGLDSWSPAEDTGDTWKGSGTTEPWAEQTERPWSDHQAPSYGGDRYDDELSPRLGEEPADRYDDELSPRPAEEPADRYRDELSPAPEQGGTGNTWAFDRNDPRLPDVVRDAERRRRESPPEPAYADWGSEDAPADPDTGTLSAAVPGSEDPLAAIADMQSRARSKDPLDDEDDRPWDGPEDQRWDETPEEGDDSWRGGEGATQMFTPPSFDSESDAARQGEYEDERDDRLDRDDRAETDYEDDFTPADYGMPERPKQAKRRRDRIAEDFPGFDEARDDGDYPGYDSIDFLADTEPGANVTLWLGVASLLPVVGVITAILALFDTGPRAKRAIRESRGTLDGLGLITTGTVFAVIGILVTVISLAIFFVL